MLTPALYGENDSVVSENHGTGLFEKLGKGSIFGG